MSQGVPHPQGVPAFPHTPWPLAFPAPGWAGGWGSVDTRPLSAPASAPPWDQPGDRSQDRGTRGPVQLPPEPRVSPSFCGQAHAEWGREADPEPPEGRGCSRTSQAGAHRSAAFVVRAWAQQPDLGMAIRNGWAARHPQRLWSSGTKGPAHPAAPMGGDCQLVPRPSDRERGRGVGSAAREGGREPGDQLQRGRQGSSGPRATLPGEGFHGQGPSQGSRSGPCAGPHGTRLAPVGGGRLLCWKVGPLVPSILPWGQVPRDSRPHPPGAPGSPGGLPHTRGPHA